MTDFSLVKLPRLFKSCSQLKPHPLSLNRLHTSLHSELPTSTQLYTIVLHNVEAKNCKCSFNATYRIFLILLIKM